MSRIPLATVADVGQIDELRPHVQGRSCVLVGSAPLTAPIDVEADDVVIPVNGAISSAPRADVWVLGSKEQDKLANHVFMRPLHRKMLEQGRGRRASHVVLLRGPKVESERYTIETLRRLSCEVGTWSVLDKPTKRWLEGEVCGRRSDKEPCSSGILAVACALWCGAASVRMVGFSLKPGYHYVKNERPPSWWRNHVAADARALTALRSKYGETLSGEILKAVAA